MVPNKALQILVFLLPLCVVGFGVVMGAGALTRTMNDAAGARVLAWVAVAILLLGVADLILLVILLGIRALVDDEKDRDVPGA